MGMPALIRLASLQRERRRGQIRTRDAFLANGKGSNCQRDDSPHGGKKTRYSGPDLPEDIWHHIHSLMPLRDAARAACVSRNFLRSWRCRPYITFSRATLGLNDLHGEEEVARDFNSKVDHILKKHSGIGLKTLKIEFCGYSANTSCNLNSWLATAVTPELEELTLLLPPNKAKYRFPSSLFSNGRGESIRRLQLSWCAFSTTARLDCMKNLTSVHLRDVRITGDALGCLLSNSIALERLNLVYCNKITFLKIPYLMRRLSCLGVFECDMLQVIESKAPNISTFHYSGTQVELSLGVPVQVKTLSLSTDSAICYARAKLPFIVPTLETLSISSSFEVTNTPMVPSTFVHLKYLSIMLSGAAFSPAYDCLSLVSFLHAAPSLETFDLGVSQLHMQHESIVGNPSPLRQMEAHCHRKLRSATITGFCSAKSLVELTCYILENAPSLDCFTLDTTLGFARCSANKLGKCYPLGSEMVIESQKALLAIGAYIEGKVPPAVKLNILGHCGLCHAV
ncbi:hypothetical protein ACP70R_043812 [Stipagrostis hirtigluma subsp. patula]